ncbi:MAG: chromate transporter [Anaerotignum sp.]
MRLLILFLEFFKIGLFSVGGGLATLPFLYDLADKYPWFSVAQIPDMIAISESTPGPLGVNMATYVGFQCGGVLGGVIATGRFGNTFCYCYHYCL